MKKTLLTMIGMMLALAVNAYTCVTFKSGDPSILMKKAGITYEIDWNNARVSNWDNLSWQQYLKKRGDDFVRDWPKDRKQAEKYFTVRFNRKSDYLQIAEGGSGEYKMIVKPSTIDVGNGGASFNPWASSKAGGVVINGTIEFQSKSGKVICVLNIVNAKGAGSPSETTRLGLVLSEIAGDLWDFVDDEVESGNVRGTTVAVDTDASVPVAEPEVSVPVKESKPRTTVERATPRTSSSSRTSQKAQTRVADDDIIEEIVTEEVADHSYDDVSLGGRKLLVTEKRQYPASYTIKIGNQLVKMILVRGGRMNMGYDGDGSRKMHSEPMHEVNVTSFYISERPLPASVVLPIVGDKNVDGQGNEMAQVREFRDVERVIESIASRSHKPYRLPTEAEWEFAACSEVQNKIFRFPDTDYICYEWCNDWLDDFTNSMGIQTDPTGPFDGEQHVVRAFNGKRGKFDRSSDIDEDDAFVGLVRLAIKARDTK